MSPEFVKISFHEYKSENGAFYLIVKCHFMRVVMYHDSPYYHDIS